MANYFKDKDLNFFFGENKQIKQQFRFGHNDYYEDQKMDFDEYQKLAMRTAPSKDKLTLEMHSLHGMASEVGEIHGIYQKTYQGHPHDKHHAMSEMSDLLWFIAEWCTANDYKLGDVAQYNIDKLTKRYPDGFSSEESLNRKQGDIQTYSTATISSGSNFLEIFNDD